MKKIEQLMDQQIARFPEFVKRWTDIGLSVAPADRVQAEHGIRLAYESAKLMLPRKIVWCGSPFSQGLTRAVLQSQNLKIGKDVWDSVWDSVRDLGVGLGGGLGVGLGEDLGGGLGGGLRIRSTRCELVIIL